MEKYYLIDYENVGSDGLCGCDRLSESDHIVIFFTNNAKKIDMREIADHGKAELVMIEVPAGRQSADIHIGSYIGYLIGSGKNRDIGVVSNDTDFDNVIKFWAKSGASVSRSRSITIASVKHKAAQKNKAEKPEKKSAEKTRKEKEAPVPKPQNKKKKPEKQAAKPKKSEQGRSELNTSVMQTLGKAGYDCNTSGAAASIAVKNNGKADGKQQVYLALVQKFGQETGLDIYGKIKKKL